MFTKISNYIKNNPIHTTITFILTLTSLTLTLILLSINSLLNTTLTHYELTKSDLQRTSTQLNTCLGTKDTLTQDYENSIPLQQYIDDIDYLESIIRDLQQQCPTCTIKEYTTHD